MNKLGKEYTITIPAHPSIYNEASRELNIYFYEPEKGVNEETGILLLISGFGGNSNSNVYKKMRKEFSYKHNLVTVQCDYFGWQYMQEPANFNINKNELRSVLTKKDYIYLEKNNFSIKNILDVIKDYDTGLYFNEILKESLDDFNDMGIMQAIDNINSVLVVKAILEDNNLNFNKNKIILYGHSHGAYLAYLCNFFAPNLFSLIIDNSAWLFPQYIKYDRLINGSLGKSKLIFEFEYLAKKINLDENILNLPNLYSKFKNYCNIVCFHGTTDSLISNLDKKKFCDSIENCIYNEISKENLDENIFKSTNHGLDADFIKLFDLVMDNYKTLLYNKNFALNNIKYQTERFIYDIDYYNEVPKVNIYKR